MIRQNTDNASLRALNIIWNAAGRYHFDPGFLAFHSNGEPDSYFNLIIGLADKWIGLPQIREAFSSFSFSGRAGEICELLWLGIENYVYERELPQRPVLSLLRRERAEAFFRNIQALSRQQMMLQSMPVFRQQQYRWAMVSGRSLPHLSARDKGIADCLLFEGTWSSGQVLDALRRLPEQFFSIRPGKGSTAPLPTLISALRARLAKPALSDRDLLLVRTGRSGTDRDAPDYTASMIPERRDVRRRAPDRQADLSYIRENFGPCLLSPAALRLLEEAVCTGENADCRVYLADPPYGKQYESNLRYVNDHLFLVRENTAALTARLDAILSTFSRALPVLSRAGRVIPSSAWRIDLLRDPRIFERDADEIPLPLRVDVLLDASRSRMNSQGRIAAQACILTQSLERCRVPVRVLSFRSLRGCTVLETLHLSGPGPLPSGATSPDSRPAASLAAADTLRYYAGGWNRDSLALKACAFLADHGALPDAPRGTEKKEYTDPSEQIHVLIVFTDASPSDPEPDALTGRPFEGRQAVSLTEQAVRDLRRQGIHVAAVFHGATAHLEDARKIYGRNCVRIRSLHQFADAAAGLIEQTLQGIVS